MSIPDIQARIGTEGMVLARILKTEFSALNLSGDQVINIEQLFSANVYGVAEEFVESIATEHDPTLSAQAQRHLDRIKQLMGEVARLWK